LNKKISILDNKTVLVTENIPAYDTLSIGIWSKWGSDQDGNRPGLCHFLEHMLFKGTANYSRKELADLCERLGGEFNAATDYNNLSVFTKVTKENTEKALELLTEMTLHSQLSEREIEKEKQVVLAEIKKYNDIPQEKVEDLFNKTFFFNGTLQHPVLGYEEVITDISREELKAAANFFFCGENTVVTAAGNVEHDTILDILKNSYHPRGTDVPPTSYIAPQPKKIGVISTTDDELINFCFAGQSIDWKDERECALMCLDIIFGGSTTSRLFEKIREELGMSYDISSYDIPYKNTGVYGVIGSTLKENLEQLFSIIRQEAADMQKNGISINELVSAKDQLKSRILLANENSLSKNDLLADSYLRYGKIITEHDMIKSIDQVTKNEVNCLIDEILCPDNWTLAVIGDIIKEETERLI